MTAQEDPYVRVYYRVLTDAKFQGLSSAAWGHWARLLVVADGLFPASAPLPRWVEDGPLAELVAAKIIDLEGSDYFRIHGMEPERERRAEASRFAADVKHHGLPEAERRRAERLAAASGRMRPQPTGGAAQPEGRADPASPLLSGPLHSNPVHSEPSQPPERPTNVKDMPTKKKPADEEMVDDLLRKWPASKNAPAWRQRLAEDLRSLGIHDPDAEIAQRRAA